MAVKAGEHEFEATPKPKDASDKPKKQKIKVKVDKNGDGTLTAGGNDTQFTGLQAGADGKTIKGTNKEERDLGKLGKHDVEVKVTIVVDCDAKPDPTVTITTEPVNMWAKLAKKAKPDAFEPSVYTIDHATQDTLTDWVKARELPVLAKAEGVFKLDAPQDVLLRVTDELIAELTAFRALVATERDRWEPTPDGHEVAYGIGAVAIRAHATDGGRYALHVRIELGPEI